MCGNAVPTRSRPTTPMVTMMLSLLVSENWAKRLIGQMVVVAATPNHEAS